MYFNGKQSPGAQLRLYIARHLRFYLDPVWTMGAIWAYLGMPSRHRQQKPAPRPAFRLTSIQKTFVSSRHVMRAPVLIYPVMQPQPRPSPGVWYHSEPHVIISPASSLPPIPVRKNPERQSNCSGTEISIAITWLGTSVNNKYREQNAPLKIEMCSRRRQPNWRTKKMIMLFKYIQF